jgi:hypothetical protein
MPRSQHPGRSGKPRKVVSKKALLPLPQSAVDEISLGYHLALAACRGTGGNSHLMNELTRALYITYYLGEMGYEHASAEFYRRAEAGLEKAIQRGHADGIWRLEPGAALVLQDVLQIHDHQLAVARTGHVSDADNRLAHFISSNRRASPFD